MSKILVVGAANIDLVTRVARCPKPGETLMGAGFQTFPGGKGANQAVAAARLGAETYFAGCVGQDVFGEYLSENLANAGLHLTYLRKHSSQPTGTAVILVADNGENTIVVTPAANHGITPADVEALKPLFPGLDAVLLQLEIRLDTVEATLDLARSSSVLSMLDAGPAQRVPDSLLQKADVVSPNETEAEAITGVDVDSVDAAKRAAGKLHELGAREVVLKLGARGALYSGQDTIHSPAFKVEAVDTTAAGDAFTAALALVWKQMDRAHALRFANAAGALATTVMGAQPSMPTRSAVDAFLQAH
ncbi:MAG: ribokinase [Candidatus Hydrogenedentes bacterium]|nr:ribokinase [Candidatus Hydrogenedentota bacterium]